LFGEFLIYLSGIPNEYNGYAQHPIFPIMNVFLVFIILAVLIALNGLFVSAEFSTVSSRPSRMSAFAEAGSKPAAAMLRIVENPKLLDAYVATCQVGITISSLVLGFFGQSELSGYLSPLLLAWGDFSETAAEALSAAIILVVLSIVQVLIGELVPKNVGMLYPERLSILTFHPMRWSEIFFRPLNTLFNGSGFAIMRLLGIEPSVEHGHKHSPEEISILVEESRAGGKINPEEHRLLKNTLSLRDSMVRQVMIPRSRMLAVTADTPPNELLALMANSPYSRAPIYTNSIDNISGIVHLRDLLCFQSNAGSDLSQIIRQVPFFPETTPVKEVFRVLQNKNFQVAIILDEYGGTAGMVTLEDLLEQIFGNFQDEFDPESVNMWVTKGNRIWMRGTTPIHFFNSLFDASLPADSVDTLGGLVLNKIGHVPIIGEVVKINTWEFKVEKMTSRGIATLSLAANQNHIDLVKESFEN